MSIETITHPNSYNLYSHSIKPNNAPFGPTGPIGPTGPAPSDFTGPTGSKGSYGFPGSIGVPGPYGLVHMAAYSTNDITITANSTWTPVDINNWSNTYINATGWNSSTGTFTVQKAGYYYIIASLVFTNNVTTQGTICIVTSGGIIYLNMVQCYAAAGYVAPCSGITSLYLDVGDTIQLAAASNYLNQVATDCTLVIYQMA